MLLIALKSQWEKFNLSSVDHEPICYFITENLTFTSLGIKKLLGVMAMNLVSV